MTSYAVFLPFFALNFDNVISTFGLTEIISCMPDRLLKNISDIDKLVNIRISTYIHICYMLFNQQQCFIYSTARFLSKLRAKKGRKTA
jgi:hypothetical protein